MDKKIQDVVDVLKEYNQEHIINLLNKLEEPKKQELLEQINKIDFHQIMELYDNTKKEIEIKENIIESIPYYDKEKLTKEQKEIDLVEERDGKITGYEFKWNPDQKVKIPRLFLDSYENSDFQVIHRNNCDSFLLEY